MRFAISYAPSFINLLRVLNPHDKCPQGGKRKLASGRSRSKVHEVSISISSFRDLRSSSSHHLVKRKVRRKNAWWPVAIPARGFTHIASRAKRPDPTPRRRMYTPESSTKHLTNIQTSSARSQGSTYPYINPPVY